MMVWIVCMESDDYEDAPRVFSCAEKAYNYIKKRLEKDESWTNDEKEWGLEELNKTYHYKDTFGIFSIDCFGYAERVVVDEFQIEEDGVEDFCKEKSELEENYDYGFDSTCEF